LADQASANVMDRMEHAILQVRKCNNTLAKASKKKRGVELFFTLSELLQKIPPVRNSIATKSTQ
jgi:hypothetical protein